MSYPNNYVFEFLKNKSIYDETKYDILTQYEIYQNLFKSLTCFSFTNISI